MNNAEKILILDANQRSALAATRSLGKAGMYVICADESKNTLAGASKYSRKNIVYPSPFEQQDSFVESLVKNIKLLGIRYLLPITDMTAQITLQMKTKFHDVIILLPNYESYMAVSDKYQLMQISVANNIPIPKTFFAKNLEELKLNVDSIQYPAVVKPGRSIVMVGDKHKKTSVKYAHSKEQLVDIINNNVQLSETKFLVQEYIEGHGEGLFVLCKDGEIMHYFSHKRIREKPPSGGVSVLSESIETRDETLEIAKKILGPLKWNGVAMVEFKITENNIPYLMEVNGRFWGSLQLAIDSGVNFPWLLYKQFTSNDSSTISQEYKKGIQLRWLMGDFDNLIITLKDKNTPNSGKVKSAFEFLKLYQANQFYEVNRIGDLKPAAYELFNYF